jgi:hypothetical protein
MRKQLATVGLAAALVAGGAGAMALVVPGISSAQSAEESTEPTDREAGRAARMAEALQPLIDAGTIDQAQADAVIAALQDAMPRGGHGGGRHGGPRLGAAADALGVTEEELIAALRDGQSLADVAAAQGLDVQGVVDALVAAARAHIAEEVAEGDLTQEKADARLAELTERVTAMVNGERPERPEGRFGMRGPRGPMGDEVDPSEDTTPSAFSGSAASSIQEA